MALVSIVVPVYNMSTKIERCVSSLLKQTYYNLEIILVDDGSNDDSLERCNKLAEKDSRIYVYHTSNRGAGPARNYGIELAKGDYIYFPDADDYLTENAISILVKAAEDCDLVVFGYKNLDSNGNIKSIKKYPEVFRIGNDIRENYSDFMTNSSLLTIQGAPWNKFFNLKLIKKHKVLFPSLRRHQDEAFIAYYMTFVKTVRFIKDVLYTYYTNDLSNEWDKYPLNYIDAVIGLLQERKENILIWNKFDYVTHNLVYREYICNFIKALELSFSPKFGFVMKDRWKWMMRQREKLEIPEHTNAIDSYHKIAFFLFKNRILILYPLLWFKVYIEKNNLKSLFR